MIDFSLKQKAFWKEANHRWNVKSGATRSGKTYLDYYIIPKRIRSLSRKDGLIVLLGNTKGTLQRNVIEPLQNIWSTSLVSDIRSDNTAMLFGERCYCLGADKVNQADRIRGSSIKYCYGDEVVTWHEDVFQMLKSRIDKPYSLFDGTCNPGSPLHWFKKFLDSDADIYLQEYRLDDNPFLPSEFIENLKKEYAGTVYYDRYILGKWAVAEGLIYREVAEGKGIVPDIPRCYTRFCISCDYGTMNPCSLGLWGFCDGVWYRFREKYYSGRETQKPRTDEEYYTMLEELADGHPVEAVVVDPSAASFIETIRRHGRYHVRPAVNTVLDGIRRTAAAFHQGKIAVCDCCTAAITEFQTYRWDEQKAEDKPIKENDHAMDEIRYFVNTIAAGDTFSFT
ncbi:MAG: PBSX family phage terminase large subunit [Candidatus Fimivicinus sp.]|nr:PBSX family phage terminase large subunit [Oscillospiraceae bacterium]MDY5590097.1 PBSX family phage terminase large subunit [Candidatus Fimivicinus sp.]